ncbi:universal stress protein [Thermocrinis minervae]|uniref:Nucleotide-binding universal stress protein, UspA family n=1 Tax=Thermocrinis minervae TaxID=381751 RepID=A0A1M6QGC6_9AQUI|nr:universal stress protein [Thermocrinis minervae]SHK19364.1 Nucleotide-binding universal stress protein, UspA family [Thermocrinis minervae]
MYQRILVGLDPSHPSLYEYAFLLGSILNIPVVGIYVLDTRLLKEVLLEDLISSLGLAPKTDLYSTVKEFMEAQADLVLDSFLSLGRQRGVKVSSFQTEGVPYEEIVKQADQEDLIVVGKRSRKVIEGLMLGSTSERVVRLAKCDVLVVPHTKRDLKRLGVAYDSSQKARKALEVVQKLADLLKAELTGLYVGDAYTEELPTFIEVRKGIPEEEIVKFCEEKNLDLLVMGAFSKSGIKELILGSTTHFVLSHAKIPLLLVK